MAPSPALRLAVIGCGAVVERFHLPAIARSRCARVEVLVDTDLSRARELASRYGVPRAVRHHREALDAVDSAIVAVPHRLHDEVGRDLLGHGVSVLMEKPLAADTAGCDRLIAAAERTGATLAVGLVRRFYPPSQYVKELIGGGHLGPISAFEAREGWIYEWDATSDFTFRKDAGGGTLADAGSHVLDLLLFWLGDLESTDYRDDAAGGVEADCVIRLRNGSGAAGLVELSRTRDLDNVFRIRGDRGSVELGTGFDGPVRLALGGLDRALLGSPERNGGPRTLLDAFVAQLEDFAEAVRRGRPPSVTGKDGRRSVALMESCRARRAPLEQPWDRPRAASAIP